MLTDYEYLEFFKLKLLRRFQEITNFIWVLLFLTRPVAYTDDTF